jgi:putative oxidoreductase
MKTKTINEGVASKRNVFARLILAKKRVIVEVIAALFILMFLYTALSKSFNIGSTENVLIKTPWFSNIALGAAWTVVMLEYLIAALLIIPKTRKIGLYASLTLMTGFTGYIVYMKAFVADLPCSCGGVISNLTWNQHLVFNIFFIILAFVGILLIRNRYKPEPEEGFISVVFT